MPRDGRAVRPDRVKALSGTTLALFTAALLAVAPQAVSAHASYVRSEPAFSATVATAPRELRIWFAQELDANGTTAQVFDQQGRRMDEGTASISNEDPTLLLVPLKDLPPGSYRVAWRSTSLEDGDSADGTFVFTVGTTGPAGSVSGDARLAEVLSVVALLASFLALWRTRGRFSRKERV